jgi:phosphoenolpyruvate carboxykinase (ATP)
LYEEPIRNHEAIFSHLGPLVVRTCQHTGRSPKDKFAVKESTSEDKIWWGDINRSFPEENFKKPHKRMCAYLQGRDVYVQGCFVGADPKYHLPIPIYTLDIMKNLS